MICKSCNTEFKEFNKHITLCPQCKYDSLPDKNKKTRKIYPKFKVVGRKKCPVCTREFDVESNRRILCNMCRSEVDYARRSEKFSRYVEGIND